VVAGYLEEVRVGLPEIQSDSPIIIRVCPKIEVRGATTEVGISILKKVIKKTGIFISAKKER
jgi:hypothetical protein